MSNKLDIGISADFDGTTDDLCIEIDATGFYSIKQAEAAVEKINEAIRLAKIEQATAAAFRRMEAAARRNERRREQRAQKIA
jgi:hypothetical protein